MLSKEKSTKIRHRFLAILKEIVENQEGSTALGFSSDGQRLELKDLQIIENVILPVFYGHRSIRKFIRTLKCNGFKQVSCVGDVALSFSHKQFRLNPQLRTMELEKVETNYFLPSETISPFTAIKMSRTELQKKISELRTTNAKLLQRNEILRLENEMMHQEAANTFFLMVVAHAIEK